MQAIELVQMENKITLSLTGSTEDIVKALITAMAQHQELSIIILAAIPSFLDVTGRSRKKFCDQVLNAAGARGQDKEYFIKYIQDAGGKII